MSDRERITTERAREITNTANTTNTARSLAADLINARAEVARFKLFLIDLADSIDKHKTTGELDPNQMLAERLSCAATGDLGEDVESIVEGLRAIAKGGVSDG